MYAEKDEYDLDKFFELRGIKYDKNTRQMILPIKCKWVTNQNKCKLYSWRPYSCRAYECENLKTIS